jgi:hypothetical protein
LNQIDNVRCLVGNLFEPVAGQQFQLIVCNPPFVISPTSRYLFRDSGERGDEFCRSLVRSTVDYLEVGGFFQFTANIAHRAGYSWKSDLETWFDGLPCDVLALVQRTEDISDYAMTWILSTEPKDRASLSQLYGTWMDYFEQERIEAISYLFIILRRSAGVSTWLQIDDPPCQIVGPCGSELLGFFDGRDRFGNAKGVEELLSQRLKLSPEIRIEQEYAMTSEGLEMCRVRANKTGGLRYPLRIDNNVGRLLASCDGNQTLGQVLQDMANDLNIDHDRAVSIVLPAVRSLIERSVLLLNESSRVEV